MPLWRIYTHQSTFSPSQREGLAKAITKLYVDFGLPPFYVNVIFIDTSDYGTYVGGEASKTFVRITVEQIARTMQSPETEKGRNQRKGWMDMINAVSFYKTL
jgi:phenylpyruvate tautomerase PptA (4-oxalocrotonate tautomerase family)